MVCRKLRGNVQVQRMADFPFDRVTPGKPPFSFVGVDCFRRPFCGEVGPNSNEAVRLLIYMPY